MDAIDPGKRNLSHHVPPQIILTFLASPQWNSFLGKHTSKLTLGSHIWLKAVVPSIIYLFISLSYR